MLEAIKQWAFTLVITAVAGGLANSFSVSENGNMKKYIKFACAAVALAVLITPVKELFREMPKMLESVNTGNSIGPEVYNYDNAINELTVIKTNELLKERIYDIVYEKTGIKPDDIDIYIKQKNNAEVYVEKIIIDMPENNEEIKLYLKQLLNCEVAVIPGGVKEKNNE